MQIVFCPRTDWDGRSATGMTSSLRMTSGEDCRGRQYSRAAAQLMSTSAALPEIRDEQGFSSTPPRPGMMAGNDGVCPAEPGEIGTGAEANGPHVGRRDHGG